MCAFYGEQRFGFQTRLNAFFGVKMTDWAVFSTEWPDEKSQNKNKKFENQKANLAQKVDGNDSLSVSFLV